MASNEFARPPIPRRAVDGVAGQGARSRTGRRPQRGAAWLLLAAIALASVPWAPAAAQVEAAGAGVVETGLLLRQLDGEKRVLMIGAHPDDEDTSLLTVLARGQGARAAYLSLSRGEGGQNLIGAELDEGLGIVRTGELLSARSLDGAEQYFTRAFDFGYSRRAEETFRHWPEEELLRDVVWVVRKFRPHVILSVFQGTSADGHGQHQAAGIVARKAFHAANDPSRFADQLEEGLRPWAPAKIYRLVRFDPGAATARVETGRLDPLLGRSHFQIAMESRSRHRSQDMGAAESPGPHTSGAALLESRVEVPREGETGFFTGVDTALVEIARAAEAPNEVELLGAVHRYREMVLEARASLLAEEPGRVSGLLVEAAEALGRASRAASRAPEGPARRELLDVLDRRREGVTEALLRAASIVVDVRVDRERILPGDEVSVQVLVWNGGEDRLEVEGIDIGTPRGWGVRRATPPVGDEGAGLMRSGFGEDSGAETFPTPVGPETVAPGELTRWAYRLSVPEDEEPSRLYYLHEEREGDLYHWPQDRELWGAAGNPPLVYGRVAFRFRGRSVGTAKREGVHVGVDKALGEVRAPVFVVPKLALRVDPETMAWPFERLAPRPIAVRVRNHSSAPAPVEVRLEAPRGWRVSPASRSLVVPPTAEGAVGFDVHPTKSQAPDGADFRAVAELEERRYERSHTFVDYPHMDPAPLSWPAGLRVSSFPVRVAKGLRVGYVMGPGDGGAQALRDLGVEVELLAAEDLASGELDRYDTIVLGIRTYETRADLIASNERLLDFARGGGTVVVQYNKYEYPDGEFAPYPVAMARPHDRVTDPDAPVTLLHPEHPVLSRPNRIGSEDFSGWIQERGLYFLSDWDDRFTPLLEMADSGQEPSRGALVVAPLGEGAYVYTGLALFRQIPAGVPGAFRLLANLVSLRGEDLRRAADGASRGPSAEEGGIRGVAPPGH